MRHGIQDSDSDVTFGISSADEERTRYQGDEGMGSERDTLWSDSHHFKLILAMAIISRTASFGCDCLCTRASVQAAVQRAGRVLGMRSLFVLPCGRDVA